jgi:hypothetical protein
LTGIFSKCLSGKEKSIKNSIKIIQLCVDHEQQLTVQEKLIEGLGNKTPKIIQISKKRLNLQIMGLNVVLELQML